MLIDWFTDKGNFWKNICVGNVTIQKLIKFFFYLQNDMYFPADVRVQLKQNYLQQIFRRM